MRALPAQRPISGQTRERLVANFYSLKTKEIPTGRVALGD